MKATTEFLEINKSNAVRLESIEALRALAALMIAIYHMVKLPNMQLPAYLDVIKLHFGLGVPLFYVLSGFVLAYGYLDKLNDRSQVVRFYIKRYFRIAPLFYIMIAVRLIVSYFRSGSYPANFHDVVINATMLFGLVPGNHESIAWAGWSIGVEILFYLIFPVIAAIINSVRTGIFALALAILISSSFYSAASMMNMGSYAYMNIVTHLPNFLAGVLAYHIWKKTGFNQNYGLGILLFSIATSASLAVVYLPFVNSLIVSIKGVRLGIYIWSIIFMMLILSLCFWPIKLFVNRITTGMGRVSFSFYLLHPLIIILLFDAYRKIGHQAGDGTLLSFLACALVTITLVSLLAHLSFRVIELPGMNYGKRLANAC